MSSMPSTVVGMQCRFAATPLSRPTRVSHCACLTKTPQRVPFSRQHQHCSLPFAKRRGIVGHRSRCSASRKDASQRPLQQSPPASALLEAPEASSAQSEALLDQNLPVSSALKLGQLQNGLRYVILPNKVPLNRFEAHLEMHVGAVEEEENQQGLAHVVEHVTFLGSKKRDRLFGTGVRSNAYTDFHHTVFHVHSPLHNVSTGQEMLPQVFEALTEIAFQPEMLASRLEKERRAVLAEAQMMNTIEYRMDCQLLTHLHAENFLGCRFPIGSTDQVKKWNIDDLRRFWQRWYFPANATLYVVGDVNMTTEQLEAQIKQHFGKIPAGRMPGPEQQPYAEHLKQLSDINNSRSSPAANQPPWNATQALTYGDGELKQRFATIPNVEHVWGDGPMQPGEKPVVAVFRHRLVQQFSLSIFSKRPVRPITTMRHLREQLMVRIVLCVLHFRLGGRYVAANPPYTAIEMDHSDSAREACAVSTLTISSEPCDWRGAIQVAVQEVRRLMQFGVTTGEMERYKAALMRDSGQLASQGDSIPSVDNLNFLMEYLALGHTFMDPQVSHEAYLALADLVTVEEVNKVARSLLSYVSHFGKDLEAMEAFQTNPEQWLAWGPSRTTSMVACIPAFTAADGHSTGGGSPAMKRGGGTVTTQHVEPPSASLTELDAGVDEAISGLAEGEDPDASQVPDGAVSFEIPKVDITDTIAMDSASLEALPDVDVPEDLLSKETVEQLLAERQPHYVPVAGATTVTTAADPVTGVVQLRLSNGMTVNFRHSSNEPQAAMMRLVSSGGRCREGVGAAPDGNGSVIIGTRTLNESGRMGEWARPQIELFCISKLINCMIEADEEFISMDFHFAVGDGGLASVLQMAHLFIEQPVWEATAMDRSKAMYASHYRALPKSLERSTADRIMSLILGEDRRFRDPSTDEIEALTLESMQNSITAQLQPSNLEVCIVGDLTVEEVEAEVLKYLGTVKASKSAAQVVERPVKIMSPPLEKRHQTWHLQDSDERATAFIAGPAPLKWSTFSSPQQPLSPQQEVIAPSRPSPMASQQEIAEAAAVRRAHPLYGTVTLMLLTEVLNCRLFATVRDALGLTYDVNFDMSLFDRIKVGWFVVNVTSPPQKIHEALRASVGVLRTTSSQRITVRELARAQRTLLTRNESDSKDNACWLRQMTHLQNDAVPLKRMECIRDMVRCLEAAAVEDLYDALSCFALDDDSIFTVVGTSGQSPPDPPPSPSSSTSIKPDARHFQAFANALKKAQSAGVAGILKPTNRKE